jgi:hypothetical protein
MRPIAPVPPIGEFAFAARYARQGVSSPDRFCKTTAEAAKTAAWPARLVWPFRALVGGSERLPANGVPLSLRPLIHSTLGLRRAVRKRSAFPISLGFGLMGMR